VESIKKQKSSVKAAVDKATRAERTLPPPPAPKRNSKKTAQNPAPMIPMFEEALGGVNYTLPAAVLERAEGMTREAGTNWSVFHLEREFYVFARHKGEVLKNPEGAFLGFVKKKIQKQA
jgi:glutamine synthetase